jgi:hypothetical protein
LGIGKGKWTRNAALNEWTFGGILFVGEFFFIVDFLMKNLGFIYRYEQFSLFTGK